MSILNYLQLQPVDPTDDGTISPFDQYDQDETIDLTEDIDDSVLEQAWDTVINDFHEDPEKLTFSNE